MRPVYHEETDQGIFLPGVGSKSVAGEHFTVWMAKVQQLPAADLFFSWLSLPHMG